VAPRLAFPELDCATGVVLGRRFSMMALAMTPFPPTPPGLIFRAAAASRRLLWLASSLLWLALSASARAEDAGTVRVAAPYVSLPVQVALAQGYFKSENLKVESTQFAGSRQGFALLNEGKLDLLLTSSDNPLNYRLNPHNAVGQLMDVQILFGHDRGFGLALVAQKNIQNTDGLRGKRVAVDAPDSGFAMTAFKMLQVHGLTKDKDYSVVSAGAFPLRLQALREGKVEATILNGDSLVRARAEGFSVLAKLSDVVSPYMGAAGVAREKWIKENPDRIVSFIRAFYRAVRWIEDPKNREAAITLFTDANTSPALAAQIYEISVDPNGLARDAELNVPGLRKVMELRQEYGGFESQQDLDFLSSPKSGLYDLSYYQRALGRKPHVKSTAAKGTAAKGTAAKGTAAKGTAAKGTAAKGTAAKQVHPPAAAP
jgi:ABC-type nitrate/sulfonate/bicarbonate transport system substrate-binding protein